MTALDALLGLIGAGLLVVETFPVWGPVLALAVVVALWRSLRPSGQHRAPGTPVRTAVRAAVRTLADTGPEPDASTALTCADTYPDVSADSGPDVSGHDGGGH